MNTHGTTATEGDAPAAQPGETKFSLMLGGPLFNLFRRTHLSGEELELLRRRVLVMIAISWLPLLLLSALAGDARQGTVPVPFLADIEVHVRFLVALPLMFGAERFVHARLVPIVRQFVERRLVIGEDLAKFQQAANSTYRLRNSVLAEVLLLVLVYTLGQWVWRNQFALTESSWYTDSTSQPFHLKPAGYWYLFVSLPIFQFVLLRWYYRLFLWFWFLFRVSRLNLQLIPTHPDRNGGLGFLGGSANAFTPFLVAQGAALAGLIASQIFHLDRNLLSFKVEIVGFVGFFVVIMLLPLTVFMPDLSRAKRRGSRNFGQLAGRYTSQFEQKWFTGSPDSQAELLGTSDLQSLADLGNSYGVVREMRLVPFGLKDIARLVGITLLPFLPLTLTAFTLDQLADRLIQILF